MMMMTVVIIVMGYQSYDRELECFKEVTTASCLAQQSQQKVVVHLDEFRVVVVVVNN